MATTAMRPGDRVPMRWDEYAALGSDVRGEYVDGELVMSPTATQRHQRICHGLTAIIDAALPEGMRAIGGWGWKPGSDEFVPDVMVFAETEEEARFTGIPHLVVEVLSTDRAADVIRKAAKYAAAGVARYWIVDPEGPVVVVLEPVGGVFVEQACHGPGTTVTLDVGPAEVTFDPGDLFR